MDTPSSQSRGPGIHRNLTTAVIIGAMGAWFGIRPEPPSQREPQRTIAAAPSHQNLSLAAIRASLELPDGPLVGHTQSGAAIEPATLQHLLESLVDPSTAGDGGKDALAPDHEQKIEFVSNLIRAYGGAADEALPLARAIVAESHRAQYDPIFVTAVIYAESTFRKTATSNRGAQGLMQIMPATGRYVSARENIAWESDAALHDPRTNLRLGIAYLKYLEQRFRGNRERVLVAYNWGPTNTDQAISVGSRFPSQSLQYAHKIISTHHKWKNEFQQFADSALGGRLLG